MAHSAEASCQRPAVAYEASIVIVTHEATTTPASADSQVRCRDRGESPRYWWQASSRETDNRCHQQINWAYRCHLTQKRAVDMAEFDCTLPVKRKNINFIFQQRLAGHQVPFVPGTLNLSFGKQKTRPDPSEAALQSQFDRKCDIKKGR